MKLARCLALIVTCLAPLAPAAAQIVFEPPVDAGGGPLGGRLLLGDLDEDGHLDLLLEHGFFGGPPTVSFGAGGGAFDPQQPLLTVEEHLGALADFDADGHLDLLAFNLDAPPPDSATVRLGVGDGSFLPPVGINGNFQNPVDAGIGDVDGDGDLDIILGNGPFGFTNGSILALLGTGDGGFGAPITVVSPLVLPFGSSGALDAGDVDGDGLIDFVYNDTVRTRGMRSNGDGSFTEINCTDHCTHLAEGPFLDERGFVLADVNADGRADLVTVARVLLALPDGSHLLKQSFPTSGTPTGVAVADFDADGVPDLAIGRNGSSNLWDPGQTTGELAVLRGQGDGSFTLPGLTISHVPQPRGLGAGDFDGDGRLDLAAAVFQNSGAVRVLRNHTYEPGSPFIDLGGSLAGSNGFPIQLASGTLVAGQPFAFKLAGGPPSGLAYHIVGLSALHAPFKGGTMIPALHLINGPFPTNAQGGLNLAGNQWPAGGSGLSIWLQFWMPNGGGPAGLVASSGVRAQIP